MRGMNYNAALAIRYYETQRAARPRINKCAKTLPPNELQHDRHQRYDFQRKSQPRGGGHAKQTAPPPNELQHCSVQRERPHRAARPCISICVKALLPNELQLASHDSKVIRICHYGRRTRGTNCTAAQRITTSTAPTSKTSCTHPTAAAEPKP